MHDLERPRVLVVDDEKAFTEVLGELLEDEGYVVLHAHDSAQALDRLGDGAGLPHLILCDVMLPGMSGAAFVAALRERYPDQRLPVLLMSASADPRVHARDVWFLPKPLDFSELVALVRGLLEPDPTRLDGCSVA